MPGCLVAPKPCGEKPVAEAVKQGDKAKCELVEEFLKKVWYHSWTDAENEEFLAERAGGNMAHVPPAVADALAEYRRDDTVRHRREQDGTRVQSSGEKDYCKCVNAVHALAQNLKVTILDLVCIGDYVVGHMILEGEDRALSRAADPEGAFGVRPPTGKAFRTSVAAVYLVEGGKITQDWLLSGSDRSYFGTTAPY